jgi:hypothetical protein
MKSSVRFAVAAVCAAGSLWSGNALAVLPSAVPANNILYFSGATATDQQLEDLGRLATGGLCQANSIDIFRGTSQRVTLCTGAGTGLNGTPIGIAKESAGGSGNGIGPVATGGSLNWLNVKAANFVCLGDNNTAADDPGSFNPNSVPVINTPKSLTTGSPRLTAAREYTNCTPIAAQTAQAGISDVEARLFGFTGTIDERAVEQIMFGVPVSLNLYRALQIAQGLTATAACDTLIEQDGENCVPSLTRGQIGAIYGGQILDWSQISGLTTAAGVTLPVNDDTSVFICRRGNTSGSQTFTQAYALGQGCGGSGSFRPADDAGCEEPGCVFPAGDGPNPDGNPDYVYASTGSGDVRNCLDARDDQNRWAIGVLSTENTVNDIASASVPGSGVGGDPVDALGSGGTERDSREFRFVGINGFKPSLEVAANGGYDMVAENVCTRGPGLTAGLRTTIANRICGDVTDGFSAGLSDLQLIRAINEGFDNQPHGDGGNLIKTNFDTLLPNAGDVSQAEIEANPVNAYSRSATGVVNNCSSYLSVGDASVNGAVLRGPVLPGDVTP